MLHSVRNPRFGIRAKLTATVTLPMAAIIVAAVCAFAAVETRHARSDAERAAEAIARALNQDLERIRLTEDQQRSADLVDRLASFSDVLRVTAYDERHCVFFNYAEAGVESSPPITPDTASPDTAAVEHRGNSIVLSKPITSASRSLGTVRVELSTMAQNRRLDRVFLILGGGAALALLTSLAVGIFIQRLVARPIVRLAATMDAVTAADAYEYDVRAAVNSNDEVGRLAQAFNCMLVRIQASDEALRAANRDLEAKVAQRTADLTASLASLQREVEEHAKTQAERERLYRELVDASRQAGMAEVATGVLHNVGNVLNSVNVSVNLLLDQCRRSRVGGVEKLGRVLDENRGNLGEFLTSDAKGKMTVDYLKALADALRGERDGMLAELDRLGDCVEHIKEIVATQQNYGRACSVREAVPLADLVEDALKINAMALERHHVTIEREFADVPPIVTERHRVLQILVNLLSNAKYATSPVTDRERRICLRIGETDGSATIEVADNGIGISADDMPKVFTHGFTTRPGGHGFGLHTSALAAKELGGSLHVASAGLGHGATFTLQLPLVTPPSNPDRHAPTPQRVAEENLIAACTPA